MLVADSYIFDVVEVTISLIYFKFSTFAFCIAFSAAYSAVYLLMFCIAVVELSILAIASVAMFYIYVLLLLEAVYTASYATYQAVLVECSKA